MVKNTQWRGVWISFLTGVLAAVVITKASPALLAMQQEMKLSLVNIGWVMSCVAISTVLLAIYTGILSQRFGPHRILQIGLLLILFASCAGAFATSLLSLIIGRSIEGIGVLFISVAAPTLVSHLSKPSDIGLTMGVWALWMPIGSLIVFLLSPFILEQLDWRWLWGSASILALPIYLLSRYIPTVNLQQATSSNDSTHSYILGSITLGFIFTFFTVNFFALITYLPSYLVSIYQLLDSRAVFITAIIPLFIIPGNLLGGFFIHHGIRPIKILFFASLILSLLMALLFNTEYSPITGLTLLACYSCLLGMIPTAIFAQAPLMTSSPSKIPSVIGIMITGQAIGILAGPPFAGFLVGDTLQWTNLAPMLIVAPLLVMILTRPLAKLQKRP